jgi:hypothetical protein
MTGSPDDRTYETDDVNDAAIDDLEDDCCSESCLDEMGGEDLPGDE